MILIQRGKRIYKLQDVEFYVTESDLQKLDRIEDENPVEYDFMGRELRIGDWVFIIPKRPQDKSKWTEAMIDAIGTPQQIVNIDEQEERIFLEGLPHSFKGDWLVKWKE